MSVPVISYEPRPVGVEVHPQVFLKLILEAGEDSISQPGIFARGKRARVAPAVRLAMNFRYVLMSRLRAEAEPTV